MPHEEKTIDRYYKRTKSVGGEPYFQLNSKDLTDTDKSKIIRILERRGFFQYENTDRLSRYYRDR